MCTIHCKVGNSAVRVMIQLMMLKDVLYVGELMFLLIPPGLPRFNSTHLQDAVQSHGCR